MYSSILHNISKHTQLEDGEVHIFTSFLKQVTYNKKQYVFTSGKIVKSTYFVNSGCLKLFQVDDDGFEKIALFAPENWWVSDLYSFYSQQPANHFLQATENSELLELSRDNLEILFKEVPKFERFFRIIQQNAFIGQNNRIMQMMTLTAEDRYLNFKKTYPGLDLRISQKDIASYLGITPEFLSSMRKRLSK